MTRTNIDNIFASIDTNNMRESIEALPPTWKDFAKEHGPDFGLDPCFVESIASLDEDLTPAYDLPPSYYVKVIEQAWNWMNVYGEKEDRTKEAATLQLLQPFLVPIIGLFGGRVMDKPEEHMTGTKYSTGGKVEHEIFLLGGVLFFVIELKLVLGAEIDIENYVAQLFLELLSAAEQNSSYNFKNLKVYGLLSDFSRFFFYTYNPETHGFYRNENLKVSSERKRMCTDLVPHQENGFRP